jgi:hypothetical protein
VLGPAQNRIAGLPILGFAGQQRVGRAHGRLWAMRLIFMRRL